MSNSDATFAEAPSQTESGSFITAFIGILLLGFGGFTAIVGLADSANVLAIVIGAFLLAIGAGLFGYSVDQKFKIEASQRADSRVDSN